MSCALVNVSWLAVTVPAPSTPSGVCGVVRGNIIFTTEKYPKEKSKPSCVFSTKPVWTWVGAHKRLLLSISRNKAGSFGGNKKKTLNSLSCRRCYCHISPTAACLTTILWLFRKEPQWKNLRLPRNCHEALPQCMSPLSFHFCFCYCHV